MTPFEQGYAAFLAGVGIKENAFDVEQSPWSYKRWVDGWMKARRDRK